MLELISQSFNRQYMQQWTDHYGQLAGQSFRSRLSYIDQRARFAADRIRRDAPSVDFSISTAGPLSVTESFATVTGRGWVDVREIRLAGSSVPLEATWTSRGAAVADTWQVRIPLSSGNHSYVLEAYDFQGNRSATDSIMITSPSTDSRMADLRISEIHYHPAEPSPSERAAGYDDQDDFEFIELVNIGDQTLDLSGVKFVQTASDTGQEGVQFDFTHGAITQLEPGQRVVVVEDLDAFRRRYGAGPPVAGQWSGGLDNSTERITLVAGGATLHQFSYRDDWFAQTDGGGYSLVVLDPAAPDRELWGQRSSWQPSPGMGGTPGWAESSGYVAGDANRDGVLDSLDIVHLLQSQKYLTGQPAVWEEGDFNDDHLFDSLDIIAILQGQVAWQAR
jgi:hypothetical protein